MQKHHKGSSKMISPNLKSYQKLNIIQNADLPLSEKALLFSLKSYEPFIFVSAERLALQNRTTERTIRRQLNKLRIKDLITETTRPGHTTTRSINYANLAKLGLNIQIYTPDTSVTPNEIPLTPVSPTPDTSVTPPLTPMSGEVSTLSNKRSAKDKNETNVSSENGGENENRERGEASKETPFADLSGSGYDLFKEVLIKTKRGTAETAPLLEG